MVAWQESGDGCRYTGSLPHDLDGGIAWRAALGLIALGSDQVIERDLRRLVCGDGVAVFTTRLANEGVATLGSLRALEPGLAAAAAAILPGEALTAIAFGCTSGTILIGEARVRARVQAVRPGVPVATPIEAARAALAALGVRRVAVLSPYLPAINRRLRADLERHGLRVAALGSLAEADDRRACRITPDSLLRATLAVGRAAPADGVFVSCTSLRAAEIVTAAEDELGMPVTTSNHALAWMLRRLAGVGAPCAGQGRLFAERAAGRAVGELPRRGD